jgi:uncharacterized metal-binding protein YceD (DUF177 family)
MNISVERLFHPNVEAIEIDHVVRPAPELAARYPGGARLIATISRISHGVHMAGALHGTEREVCARCLETFDRPIAIDVQETFSEDVGKDEDFYADVSPLVGRIIDLTDLVSQLLEVDEPMAALCSPSCKGICPACGANRNKTPCACVQAAPDPRLAGLARLRDELETR